MTNKSCSNCGNPKILKAIRVNNKNYCDACIDSFGIKTNKEPESILNENILHPDQINEKLGEVVIGQENARKRISTLLFKHLLKRYNLNLDTIHKSNCILIGDSGTGKTLLAKTASNILDIPFHIVDSTTLTESGYVGEDASSILHGLLEASNWDISKAEYGIVFIDEIDKKARHSKSFNSKDVSGSGVQQALLKIVEGTTVKIYKNKTSDDYVYLNTSNILFIAAGAFVGINKFVNKRNDDLLRKFVMVKDEIKQVNKFLPDDLINFGMIPEFIGRFPNIISFDKLTEGNMLEMLEYNHSILNDYIRIFEYYDINLIFSNKLLHNIAKQAMLLNTGARALHSVIEESMAAILYNIHNFKLMNVCRITLNEDLLENNESFTIEYKQQEKYTS